MQNEQTEMHGRRVLVVDDSEALAMTLCWMLEALGYTAHYALSAESGLKKALEFAPEILLLDISLPGKTNGYDLCRQMRTMPEFANSFFVAQTGWTNPEHRERAVEAGFHHHLVKPVDIQALEALLQRI